MWMARRFVISVLWTAAAAVPWAICVYLLPVFGFPIVCLITLFQYGFWEATFGGQLWAAYEAIYSLCPWLWGVGTTAFFAHQLSTVTSEEVGTVLKYRDSLELTRRRSWFNRLVEKWYLHRNRRILDSYRIYQDTTDASRQSPSHFQEYLVSRQAKPSWAIHEPYAGVQSVGAYVRRGHVRNTINGPVLVSAHVVRSHIRLR